MSFAPSPEMTQSALVGGVGPTPGVSHNSPIGGSVGNIFGSGSVGVTNQIADVRIGKDAENAWSEGMRKVDESNRKKSSSPRLNSKNKFFGNLDKFAGSLGAGIGASAAGSFALQAVAAGGVAALASPMAIGIAAAAPVISGAAAMALTKSGKEISKIAVKSALKSFDKKFHPKHTKTIKEMEGSKSNPQTKRSFAKNEGYKRQLNKLEHFVKNGENNDAKLLARDLLASKLSGKQLKQVSALNAKNAINQSFTDGRALNKKSIDRYIASQVRSLPKSLGKSKIKKINAFQKAAYSNELNRKKHAYEVTLDNKRTGISKQNNTFTMQLSKQKYKISQKINSAYKKFVGNLKNGSVHFKAKSFSGHEEKTREKSANLNKAAASKSKRLTQENKDKDFKKQAENKQQQQQEKQSQKLQVQREKVSSGKDERGL